MESLTGKKIFFLFPPKVIQEEMVHLLMAAEYEVALLDDPRQALRVLGKFPDSILFVNIDEGPEEPDWDKFIRGIMADSSKLNVKIGVVSHNPTKEIAEKYLRDIKVPCGFVSLKLGLKESFKTIVKALEAHEARGRRKYVRAVCRPQDKASFNVKFDGDYLTGSIIDISSVGMACVFDKSISLKVGTGMGDIQLKLRAALCKVSGKLIGFHSETENRHVILFEDTIPREKQKIHQFVYNKLQEEIGAI